MGRWYDGLLHVAYITGHYTMTSCFFGVIFINLIKQKFWSHSKYKIIYIAFPLKILGKLVDWWEYK